MAGASISQITSLIQFYQDNQRDYEDGGYKEARARSDLIDRFFQALGWDVRNDRRYAEAYQEVVIEDSIQVEGRAKAPDYCFRVGQTPKFFVEAKKPSAGIRDNTDAAYQLRRYAWSANLQLSILTNFRELAVYDCRVRPRQLDSAATARILYLSSGEYLGRWNELEGVFSKEAWTEGLFRPVRREGYPT